MPSNCAIYNNLCTATSGKMAAAVTNASTSFRKRRHLMTFGCNPADGATWAYTFSCVVIWFPLTLK